MRKVIKISDKKISFFDWEQSFKSQEKKKKKGNKKKNSLGISNGEFKDFIKKWKNNELK